MIFDNKDHVKSRQNGRHEVNILKRIGDMSASQQHVLLHTTLDVWLSTVDHNRTPLALSTIGPFSISLDPHPQIMSRFLLNCSFWFPHSITWTMTSQRKSLADGLYITHDTLQASWWPGLPMALHDRPELTDDTNCLQTNAHTKAYTYSVAVQVESTQGVWPQDGSVVLLNSMNKQSSHNDQQTSIINVSGFKTCTRYSTIDTQLTNIQLICENKQNPSWQ